LENKKQCKSFFVLTLTGGGQITFLPNYGSIRDII